MASGSRRTESACCAAAGNGFNPVAIAAWVPQLSLALYVTVALTWFIPDRRIERALGASGTEHA